MGLLHYALMLIFTSKALIVSVQQFKRKKLQYLIGVELIRVIYKNWIPLTFVLVYNINYWSKKRAFFNVNILN